MNLLQKTPIRFAALALWLFILFGPVPLPWRVLTLAAAALVWTWAEAGSLAPIGLGRHPLAKTLRWGLGLAAAVIVFGQVAQLAINEIVGARADLSAYGALEGNAPAALALLAKALTSAAFGEEILFRGFLLHQLVAIFGPGARARWIAIVAGGVAFGVAHYVQGPMGIVTTGAVGVVFGWMWFRSGRNLWALILAHAVIDSFGIAMLYLGWPLL